MKFNLVLDSLLTLEAIIYIVLRARLQLSGRGAAGMTGGLLAYRRRHRTTLLESILELDYLIFAELSVAVGHIWILGMRYC